MLEFGNPAEMPEGKQGPGNLIRAQATCRRYNACRGPQTGLLRAAPGPRTSHLLMCSVYWKVRFGQHALLFSPYKSSLH